MAKQINQGGNQMKRKKLMALFMTTAVAASMLTGCGGGWQRDSGADRSEDRSQS